jgi:hypothetical protein
MIFRRSDWLVGGAVAALTLFTSGAIQPASAATMSYALDTILGGTLTPSAFNYGTFTYADNANGSVDFTIDTNPTGERVQEVFLNYNDTRFSNATSFTVTGDVTSFQTKENNQQADGYSSGKFDIQLPSNGNIGFAPITFNIALASQTLTIADFEFIDTSNSLYNAVHLGACGSNVPGCPSGQSIWVGGDGLTTTQFNNKSEVPEPTSMALFGVGVIGLGMLRRRMRPAS